MPTYAVFGGRLRSEIDFPELRSSDDEGPPTWRLVRGGGVGQPPGDAPDGEEQIPNGPLIRLWLRRDRQWVWYNDTGLFEISDEGRAITWYPSDAVDLGLVRSDVLGRVFAVALQSSGHLCLHASAVATPNGAVAFLAPKFFGKSTLAMALTQAGARLVTDDTFVVWPDPPAYCLPGVHAVRLRTQAALHLMGENRGEDSLDSRMLVNDLPDDSLARGRESLAALYLLRPVPEGGEVDAAVRSRIGDLRAAMGLVSHVKTGELTRGAAAAEALTRVSELVRQVPVFELRIVRDLSRLPEVTRTILGWHAQPSSHEMPLDEAASSVR